MDLVAPIIPDAQKNRAPDLLLEGLGRGLSAMAQFASIRRQSEADVARLVLQERNADREHDLNARRMAMDYELKDRQFDIAEEMLPYQQRASDAQTELNTQHAKAFEEGVGSAAQIKAEATRQKTLLLKEVADNARSMKLDDPHFQTKEPMAFARNVLEFGRMYHLSPLPEVKQAIKSYQAVADSQKLFIKHGIEDESGKIKGTGQGRQVPAWRIISNVNNPETREQTLRDLEASGYTELVEGFQEQTIGSGAVSTDWKGKQGDKVRVPTKTRVLKGPIKKMVEESLTLDTPESVMPSEAPTAVPEPTPPDYGPDAETPEYPVGTRGKRRGKWFVLTEEGWKPE